MSIYTVTAHDALDYLLQSTGGGAQDQEHRVLRSAIHHSYRDVTHAKSWLWFVTESSVTIVADKNTYLLPVDCVDIDALTLPDRTTVTSYITPTEWVRLEQNRLTLGEPVYWTVMKATDPKAYDRWELRIAGKLPAGTELRYTYRRRPKPLTLMGQETQCRTGYADVAGTDVTGKNTAFPVRSVGAIFRVGTPANYPEPLSGMYPYTAQSKIAERADGNGLTLEDDIGTFTDCRYVISDHLDVSPNMYTALLTGAELWLARLQGKNIEGAVGLYQRDLKLAMEQDVVAPVSGRRAPYDRVPDATSATYAGSYSSLGPDQGA
jgi:hypothetical protein